MNINNEEQVFEELLEFIRRSRGFDFTGYKRSSLMRRVRKQMSSYPIETYSDYLDYLQVHPEEFVPLLNTILINVTAFFRDASTWKYLQTQTIPHLINHKPEKALIRVWSAGCASGDEAYTLAIILAEAIGLEKFRQQVKIYATDIDEEALSHGRQATYTAKQLQPLAPELREKYFQSMGDGYVFRPDLRRLVIFGRHDLVQDAPISRLDLLVCRNTLMYFNSETQMKILERFHFALNETGLLFLGKAEMLLNHSNLFTPTSLQHRIFRRVAKNNQRDRSFPLVQMAEDETGTYLTQHFTLQQAAFDTLPIAQLIVDYQGNLVLANQTARTMFGINILDQGRPLQELEISYRPLELRPAIEQAYQQRIPILITDVIRNLRDNRVQYLDVDIVPLEDKERQIVGVSITFNDMTRYQELQAALQQTNQELETANEELQSSNEELETTNEELQSANEELETTNEELQSTNEELETMNEELQSTNEELQTINEELRQRTNDLNQVNSFLNSILASLQAGVIVIDRQFNVLSWNEEAENLWGMRREEVYKKSLFSLDIGLPVERLQEPIRNCLAGVTERQEMLIEAVNRRGRRIGCLISYNPWMDSDQERAGVILLIKESQSDET